MVEAGHASDEEV